MKAKIARWGNSLALRLPKTLIAELGLGEDSIVEFAVVDGQLVVRPTAHVPTLEELVAGITPENRHQEIDWGPAQGTEFW